MILADFENQFQKLKNYILELQQENQKLKDENINLKIQNNELYNEVFEFANLKSFYHQQQFMNEV